jgi:hypothetical protein
LFVFLGSLLLLSQIQAASPTPTPSPTSSPSPGSSPGTNTGSGTSVSLGGLSPVGESTTVPQIIGNVVKAVLGVVGALALLMVVYGGILLLSSAGKQDQIKKGKDVLIWATIGVAVVLGSYVLVDFIISGIEGGGGNGGSNGGGATTDTRCEDSGAGDELWACFNLMEYGVETKCLKTDSVLECADKLGFTNCKTGLCPGDKWNICCEWQIP